MPDDEPTPEMREMLDRMLGGPSYWILVGREVIPTNDVLEWGHWFHDHQEDRIIAKSDVQSPGGRIFNVSTVFLGLDHSFGTGPPLLFETMIFDRERINRRISRGEEGELVYNENVGIRWDDWQMRYSTLDAAEAGHLIAVEAVRTGKDPYEE